MISVAEDDLGAGRGAPPSAVIALTVAAVPTGMNTGVSTNPCAVVSRPRRAAPSRAKTSKSIVNGCCLKSWVQRYRNRWSN